MLCWCTGIGTFSTAPRLESCYDYEGSLATTTPSSELGIDRIHITLQIFSQGCCVSQVITSSSAIHRRREDLMTVEDADFDGLGSSGFYTNWYSHGCLRVLAASTQMTWSYCNIRFTALPYLWKWCQLWKHKLTQWRTIYINHKTL